MLQFGAGDGGGSDGFGGGKVGDPCSTGVLMHEEEHALVEEQAMSQECAQMTFMGLSRP